MVLPGRGSRLPQSGEWPPAAGQHLDGVSRETARRVLNNVRAFFSIAEGRAANKSPHYKFGHFLSISQQGVSADIIQSSAVGNFSPKTEEVYRTNGVSIFINYCTAPRDTEKGGRRRMRHSPSTRV